MRKITDVRYICAVPPMDDDNNTQNAFRCLYKHKATGGMTVEELASHIAVSEKKARKALTTLLRNDTTCVMSYDGDDGQPYYAIPNAFFHKTAAGTALCVICHALTEEERDSLNWLADDLMTKAGLEFAGDAEDTEDEHPSHRRPMSKAALRQATTILARRLLEVTKSR